MEVGAGGGDGEGVVGAGGDAFANRLGGDFGGDDGMMTAFALVTLPAKLEMVTE